MVDTDASGEGLGAVLSQVVGGCEHVWPMQVGSCQGMSESIVPPGFGVGSPPLQAIPLWERVSNPDGSQLLKVAS